MLALEQLEGRLTPSTIPGWDGPTQRCSIPEGEVLAAGNGGGPRILILNRDGSERFSGYSFESSFRGGCRIAVGSVAGQERIYVGPGAGGGPVLVEYDLAGNELSRKFVGSPDSRDGFDPGSLVVLDSFSQNTIQPPQIIVDAANSTNSFSGWTRQQRFGPDLRTLIDAGPTKYGIGIVFSTLPAYGELRNLLPSQVADALYKLGVDPQDFYVAIGSYIAEAKTCLSYLELDGSAGPNSIAISVKNWLG